MKDFLLFHLFILLPMRLNAFVLFRLLCLSIGEQSQSNVRVIVDKLKLFPLRCEMEDSISLSSTVSTSFCFLSLTAHIFQNSSNISQVDLNVTRNELKLTWFDVSATYL